MILQASIESERFLIENEDEEFDPEEMVRMFQELMGDIGKMKGWSIDITLQGNGQDTD